MAYEIPGFSLTLTAAEDLTSSQYRGVKLNASGKVAKVAAAGVDYIGILQDKPEADEACRVMTSGVTKAVAGGTIPVGSGVRFDANGDMVAADEDERVGIYLGLAAAADNDIITVFLLPATRVGRKRAGTYRTATLSGNDTLTTSSARHQRLDPGGASRDVTLPAEASSTGLDFEILNLADAAEDLVVKDDGGATIVTISQNEKAKVVCNGTTWVHMGIETIALS